MTSYSTAVAEVLYDPAAGHDAVIGPHLRAAFTEAEWAGLGGHSHARSAEWLAGRLAAKRAVVAVLNLTQQASQEPGLLGAVEIVPGVHPSTDDNESDCRGSHRPWVRLGERLTGAADARQISISISHRPGRALAAALLENRNDQRSSEAAAAATTPASASEAER